MSKTQKLILLRALLIIMAGFWAFAPALRGDWLMDDDMYVTQNILLHDPARLWKIWFVPGSLVEYYPIEATVQALQWHLWHLDTFGYHLTNLVLHLLSGLLVWRLLAKFGLRFAWLGGFLFVIHPAVVESVAWISELKNTLSLPPFLLAMCAWIDYEEHQRPRDYFLALCLFLLAMLCKISMALFPFVLLLYAWWKRDRIGPRDLKVAAPFFAISLVLGLTTYLVGKIYLKAHLQLAENPRIGDFTAHLALAGQTMAFYFVKCVCPVEMIPIYPKWPINPDSILSFLPWPILALVLFYLWANRATWGRHALLGLGFFLLNLLPFLGFNSVTFMGFTWVMDHFLYLPITGLIGLAIAALENIDDQISEAMRPLLAGLTGILLALLTWECQDYAGKFAGPEKFWSYTIEHNSTSWLAYNNLGNALFETGRLPQAIDAYEGALKFNPNSVEAHNNLGRLYFQLGRTSEAIDQYEQALKINPHFIVSLTNLADALASVDRESEAIDHYQEALRVNPRDEDARAALAKLKPPAGTPPP